ncbi:hypothetical protein BJI67_08135 [Acidihalobacter aeolianus]|uniref:Uncharacterized protein n=2 Tax=Acidihalobacter aeolianus TaxID=2792603 RepID=A0A1D8K7X5_9GAMM|nr:hypothetical protein BJI67_08135 [Acidihalobacter aeolianus]
MPPAAWKWFRTVTDGIPYAQNWEGWGFKDGKLWSPEQDSFSPGEIRSLTILQQLSRGKTGSHHFKPSDLLLGVDERVADHLKLIGKLDLVGLMLALIYSDNLKIPESEEREQVEEGLRKLIAGVQRVQHQQAMVTA